MPGLWYLVPLTFGIIFFLITLCFTEFEKNLPAGRQVKIVLFSAIMSSLFYPPLIPFYAVLLFAFPLLRKKKEKTLSYKTVITFLLSLVSVALIFLMLAPNVFGKAFEYIFSRIAFKAFVLPYMTVANFYDIIPLFSIIAAILGLYFVYKNKKWPLLGALVLGIIYWVFYAFSEYRFFAEYERIVILTSIIVVIISGFGLSQIENFMKSNFGKPGLNLIIIAEVFALIAFLFMAGAYTQREGWKKVVLIHKENGSVKPPRAPANSYLTNDDLKIFKNIKDKNFLSLAWKGTTIGISTKNYPVLAKQGTISVGSQSALGKFTNGNCKKKASLAKKLNLDYIYLYKIDCPNFKKVAKSQEGLVLYKTLNEPKN